MVIMHQILRTLAVARLVCAHLTPVWVPRDTPFLQEADALSKGIDANEWQFPMESIRELEDRFGRFSIDLFASPDNAKCARFYAKEYCSGATGANAFAHSWEGENAWCAPPIGHIITVVRRILAVKMRGVLAIPLWSGAKFWTACFEDGRHAIAVFRDVTVRSVRTVGWRRSKKDILSGTTVWFLLLHFVSSGLGPAGLEAASVPLHSRCMRRLFGKVCDCTDISE